jgi:hypothetical protein
MKYEITRFLVWFLGLFAHPARHEGRSILHTRWYFQF